MRSGLTSRSGSPIAERAASKGLGAELSGLAGGMDESIDAVGPDGLARTGGAMVVESP